MRKVDREKRLRKVNLAPQEFQDKGRGGGGLNHLVLGGLDCVKTITMGSHLFLECS